MPKRENSSGNIENIKQPKIEIEFENENSLKTKNAEKLIENENDIETRINTDSLSNGSNVYKNKEGNIKKIQNAFRRYKNKKVALKERNKLSEILKTEYHLTDGKIEEKNNMYMRKSLKYNEDLYLSNKSSTYLSEKDDKKGKS